MVFVDVEESTFNMDLNHLEHVLRKEKVKAVVVVHLFGRTMDLEALSFLREKYGVMVLEDCAQSFGSEWKFENGKVKRVVLSVMRRSFPSFPPRTWEPTAMAE